jgi:hypothetical protein
MPQIDGGSGILQLSEMPYNLVQTNAPDVRHYLLSVSSPQMKPQRERYTNKSPRAQVLQIARLTQGARWP